MIWGAISIDPAVSSITSTIRSETLASQLAGGPVAGGAASMVDSESECPVDGPDDAGDSHKVTIFSSVYSAIAFRVSTTSLAQSATSP